MRIFKTLGAVLLVCAAYGLLGGRNPCFACIGAVFGMGSFWREGVRHGGNRFLGTLLGGLVVIPFYWLYTNLRPAGAPLPGPGPLLRHLHQSPVRRAVPSSPPPWCTLW